MKIILRKDVDDLGLEGDIVDVARGYARNYLVPRKLGMEATRQNIQLLESQRKKIEVRRLKAREEAERLRDRVSEIVIQISQKAGEEDKLYGSVTSMDLAEQLEKQGIVIDRRRIELDKPIKTLGEHKVPVKIYKGVTALVKVVIVREE
jgi:large subunit ribosomal protein L9